MKPLILLDTGPLVALLNRSETEHARVTELAMGLPAPFVTVEPVLTEACFLLRRIPGGGGPTVMKLLREGMLTVGLSMGSEAAALEALLRKYADVPMSLADACLVRLAERDRRSTIFTLDSDFEFYRTHGRQRIRVIGPSR